MQIKVAFFKGKGAWHNKVVRQYTNSQYSHAELILPDGKTALSIVPFSRQGVRHEPFDYDEEWDFISIEIDEHQHDRLINFYNKTKGDGYDWFGMIASKFTPFHVKRIGRWYCSEWIAYALRLICVVDNVYAYSDLTPQRLYELLKTYRLEQQVLAEKHNETPMVPQDSHTPPKPIFKPASAGVYVSEAEL